MDAIKKFNYRELTEHPKSKVFAPGNFLLLNIIIGTKGRAQQLQKCLEYLILSVNEAKISCSITVVELDNNPTLKAMCLSYGASYAFVPLELCNTKNKFSRGLAFDIGFMISRPSKWIMNIDNDLLVNRNYFTKLKPYLALQAKTHIQPYGGKYVRRATDQCTRKLLSNDLVQDLDKITDYTVPQIGACGGAIIVDYEAYQRVGGYDECFYDWGPEDQMFFLKLECLNGTVNQTTDAHKGYCTYAPDLYLLHLEHEKLWTTNPKLEEMQKIYSDFCNLPFAGKMAYIEDKAFNFKKQKQKYEQF